MSVLEKIQRWKDYKSDLQSLANPPALPEWGEDLKKQYESLSHMQSKEGMTEEEVKVIDVMKNSLSMMNVVTYFLSPVSRVLTYIHKNRMPFLDTEGDGVCKTSEDLFSVLELMSEGSVLDTIEKLTERSSVRNEMLDAYHEGNQEKFCHVIEDNDLDVSKVSGVVSALEIASLTPSINTDPLINGSVDPTDTLTGMAGFMDNLRDFREMEGLTGTDTWFSPDNPEVADILKMLKSGNMDYRRMVEFVEEQAYHYYSELVPITLDRIPSSYERDVFEQIYTYPENAELIARFKERLEKEGLDPYTQSHHASVDYSQYDNIFSKQPDKDISKYIGVNYAPCRETGRFSEIIRYLYQEGYVKRKDIKLFVYRMTGRNVDGVTYHASDKIWWRKDDKDCIRNLYYLCQLLATRIDDREKTLNFFDVSESKYFHGKYDAEPGFKGFLESVLGKLPDKK